MRIFAIVTIAFVLSFGVFSSAPRAAAAQPDFDAEFQGESPFLSLAPGQTGVFVALFRNTGTKTWRAGADQVNLAICSADGSTCGVASPNASWAANWLSTTAYATHSGPVAPGGIGVFNYQIQAPPTAKIGAATRFDGDLVVASTGRRFRPMGYYQAATGTLTGATAAVTVDLTEYKIALSASSVAAATVSFKVTNSSTQMLHELLVVKTDLAPDKLPVDASGNVDEKAVVFAGKAEDIDPADSRDLTVALAPGKYVLICNQPGHYKAGMRTAFTVR